LSDVSLTVSLTASCGNVSAVDMYLMMARSGTPVFFNSCIQHSALFCSLPSVFAASYKPYQKHRACMMPT
jgi:hypothetical protein